ncbi:MAG: hypothetical protein J6N95_05575 [Bacilli bacterium]|nr:hypothetical protein [Bacilli bacterium]
MVDNEFIKIEFEKYRLWIQKRNELSEKLIPISDELYDLKGINYAANNIHITRDLRALELKKLDLIEKKDLIENQIQDINNHINYLYKLSDKAVGMERTFIVAHYFEYKSHTKIAEEYHYSRRTVGYIIDRGFRRIAKALEVK